MNYNLLRVGSWKWGVGSFCAVYKEQLTRNSNTNPEAPGLRVIESVIVFFWFLAKPPSRKKSCIKNIQDKTKNFASRDIGAASRTFGIAREKKDVCYSFLLSR
jgi:hypothetical protein